MGTHKNGAATGRERYHERSASDTEGTDSLYGGGSVTACYAISGSRNFRGSPAAPVTASAARYPLRTAPSIVAGQPQRVQSPARKRLGILVGLRGRNCSRPGLAENVARTSFTTCAFSIFASAARGKNSANSRTASAITSARLMSTRLRDALTTNCR